jgi:transposase
MTYSEAARVFGVSRQAIYGWMRRVGEGGIRALRSRPRGRPPVVSLKPYQAATTVRIICGGCPDQMRLPFALWTRDAVRRLLAQRFGVKVSVWTVGRYLAGWGLTPQKPLRRAFEQDPEKVRRWLKIEYPRIRARSRKERAQIHWGDEMGLRSDHQAGRSYDRRGRTPVVPGTGKRFRCNVISTVTNRGKLAFMIFEGRFTDRVFIAFLRRLLRHTRRRVFLIVDRHPVHRARRVQVWIKGRRGALRLFFLPPYSPDLNPDELLNQDVKTNALGRQRPRHRAQLIRTVSGYLRRTQRRPRVVRNYFRHEAVRYAA